MYSVDDNYRLPESFEIGVHGVFKSKDGNIQKNSILCGNRFIKNVKVFIDEDGEIWEFFEPFGLKFGMTISILRNMT